MKKFIALALVTLFALSLLAACGDNNAPLGANADNLPSGDNGIANEQDNAQIGANNSEDGDIAYHNDDYTPEEDLSLSGVLYDFTFKLEGDAITLPLTLGEFRAYGWEPVLNLVESVGGNTTSVAGFERNGKRVSVSLVNMTGESLPINECLAYGIKSYNYEIYDDDYFAKEDYSVIELPKGIVLGVSTKNDVIRAFGYPTYSQPYYEDDYEGMFDYRNSDLLGENNFLGESRGTTIIFGKEKGDVIMK